MTRGRAPIEPGPAAGSGGESERHDAFISYSHVDREFAIRLCTALREHGTLVWMDEAEIHGGSRWREELERAIEGADTFVFLVSSASAQSSECRKELDHAARLSKRILPVRAQDTPPETLPESISEHQFIPAREPFAEHFDGSLAQLITEIETDRDWVREHTEWGEKAVEWERNSGDASYLLSGSELELAEQWRGRSAGKRPEVSKVQNDYFDASRQAATRRLRRTRSFVSGALVVAVGLAVLALIQRQTAVSESHIAKSGELAANSLLELGTDPQLSLLLADQSARTRETSAALDALRRALPANYLQQTLRVPGDDRPLASAESSPDGSLVVTASLDGYERVWSLATGRVLRTFPGATYYTQGASFDGTGDKVMTWIPGRVQIWDLRTTAAPVTIVDDSFGKLSGAAINRDGSLVATSAIGGSGAAIVWDASTGRVLHVLQRVSLNPNSQANDQPGSDIEFSSDGRMVATTNQNGTASVWDARTGSRLLTVKAAAGAPANPQSSISEAAFSPNGTRLLTSTVQLTATTPPPGETEIWNLANGRELAHVNGAGASWSPLGGDVVTTSNDGTARVWVADTGRLVSQFKRSDSTPITGQAKFAPDTGTQSSKQVTNVLTGSQTGSGAIFNAISGNQTATLAGDFGSVTPIGFTADGNRAVTFSSDGTVRVWGTGVVPPQPAPAPRSLRAANLSSSNVLGASFGLAADPLAPLLAVGGYQSPLTVLDARTGSQVAQLPAITKGSYNAAAFDGAGRVMLVMTYTTAVQPAQLRLAHGGALLHALAGPGSPATGGAVSPDGKLAATLDGQNRIAVWDVASGRRLALFRAHVGHRSPYGLANVALKFSPAGTLVLSADESGHTYVWQPRTGRIVNRIDLAPEPTGMYAGMGGAISPNDQYVVATASWDNSAHVFRVGGPQELITLRGHADGIDDASFGPDSSLIATVSQADQTVRVWDTQHPQALLTIPEASVGGRVDFSHDGRSLVTNGAEPYETLPCVVCGGFSRLLGLAHQRETRTLTPEERALYLGA